ncbi:hypothetical protein [Aidingimonas lacisalsi]|uniref:hypothetical protein n=1 Tax=Aidingimonas lacisalsi TaxID=2604086 RepID=UPI0011D1C06E|nr:hypothetical protein [Aidingimonas lacisalsi]
MSNTQRIQTTRLALHSACRARGENPDHGEDAVIDLLTDLRHHCRAAGIDYDACDRMAADHQVAEGGAS